MLIPSVDSSPKGANIQEITRVPAGPTEVIQGLTLSILDLMTLVHLRLKVESIFSMIKQKKTQIINTKINKCIQIQEAKSIIQIFKDLVDKCHKIIADLASLICYPFNLQRSISSKLRRI
jgi:hypothetical protein